MSSRPPKSPLRILSGRRQRMLLETEDIVSWWYSTGPGIQEPKLNIVYTRYSHKLGMSPDLAAFLRKEMRERGWREYETYADEQEAIRHRYNAELDRLSGIDKAQQAADAERRANSTGPVSPETFEKIETERKGGQIAFNIIAIVLVLGVVVKCTGIGGSRYGCSRADAWQCD